MQQGLTREGNGGSALPLLLSPLLLPLPHLLLFPLLLSLLLSRPRLDPSLPLVLPNLPPATSSLARQRGKGRARAVGNLARAHRYARLAW
jgi:hypothetical protein